MLIEPGQLEPSLHIKDVIFFISLILTNSATFYTTRSTVRKNQGESEALSVKAVNDLWKMWEEMRRGEENQERARRLIQKKLDECEDKKSGCMDCLASVEEILGAYNENSNSAEILKNLLILRKQIKDVQEDSAE